MWRRQRNRRWRIARREVRQAQIWFTSGMAMFFSVIVPVAAGVPVSLTLGLAGVAVGVIAFGAQTAQSRVVRPRKIVFISSSQSFFSKQIFIGLQDGLRGKFSHEVYELTPVAELSHRSLESQIEILRERTTSSADAIIIRPAELTVQLNAELVRLSQLGILVVFLNTHPDLDAWMDVGARLPRFVGSDMQAGGQLIARLLLDLAEDVEADGIILFQGPSSKISNIIRSAWAAREIMAAVGRFPCILWELEGFDHECVTAALRNSIKRLDDMLGRKARRIAVHPGTDRAASIASAWLAEQRNVPRNPFARELFLVGYDGLTQPDGILVANETPNVYATIDQCPYLIGREAAGHVTAAFEGRTAEMPREVVVQPKIIKTTRWHGRAETTRSNISGKVETHGGR
jgi:ABC-type sugar transport system substrate-binding protein